MWKPGDLGILVGLYAHLKGFNGRVVEVDSVEYLYEKIMVVDSRSIPGYDKIDTDHLRPIDPPEKGSWSDCVWQPKILERVT
jgi:hypothetical protein